MPKRSGPSSPTRSSRGWRSNEDAHTAHRHHHVPGLCLAYFFSALLRAITATLSPTLTREFALNAQDLGLLAGGYFFGFAADPVAAGHAGSTATGPKRVILSFMLLAVAGCVAFSVATSFTGLLAARVLCGSGSAPA